VRDTERDVLEIILARALNDQITGPVRRGCSIGHE